MVINDGSGSIFSRHGHRAQENEPSGKAVALDAEKHELEQGHNGATRSITPQELDMIWAWNRTVPPPTNQYLDVMIEETAQANPNALAISAWDGELTYGELVEFATRLANRLIATGVAEGIFVPLCFEKSKWTTVAMLAVLKAGGAFSLLDPSVPEQRHQSVVRQLGAHIILAMPSTATLAAQLCKTVLQVNQDFIDELPHVTKLPLVERSEPFCSAVYAVTTSGSTGVPKCMVISHGSFCSGIKDLVQAGFTEHSRVFDFSAYAFDVSISNVTAALVSGGCLCVPSERDRKDNLSKAIASTRATILNVTTTVARLLDPATLPDLKTIILLGEPVYAEDAARWLGKVTFVNAYGPCECPPISTMNHNPTNSKDATSIGKGTGLVTWIVDPGDHNQLLPPGCTGELLLEGPPVGRGYLNNPERTSAVFVETPTWLRQGSQTTHGREGMLYKTGDLVRYKDDGSLVFVGRKDFQVKIRGQRFELEEVEKKVQECVKNIGAVVADVIVPKGENAQPTLVAFVPTRDCAMAQNTDGVVEPEVFEITEEDKEKLAEKLPSYMIPTILFAIDHLPLTSTGKRDRIALRKIGGQFSLQGFAEIRTVKDEVKRQPATYIEQQVRAIWSQVLGIDQRTIGLDDSFFKLGGDSVLAMKVVAVARKSGLGLTVADILQYPTLQKVSSRAHCLGDQVMENIAPFGLLGEAANVLGHFENTAHSHLTVDMIEDAYPCTPLQEDLISLALKSPGDYIMQAVLTLSPNIDIQLFGTAWESVVRSMPILRTTFMAIPDHGLLQVVVNKQIVWAEANSLSEYLSNDKKQPMDVGKPFTRYALIKGDLDKYTHFVWTVHHALYDGWSLPIITTAVQQEYIGHRTRPEAPFQDFIKYVLGQDQKKASEYWKTTLLNCESVSFPSLAVSGGQTPAANSLVERRLLLSSPPSHYATMSTMIRAAWAMITANITSSEDVVFGVTVSGRNAPVPGIDQMTGPTSATVPFRVRIPKAQTVANYIKGIQTHEVDMIPFEQTGLHHIAKMSADCQQACQFQTLLVIQPEEHNNGNDGALGSWREDAADLKWFNTYGLVLDIQLGGQSSLVKANFDSNMISDRMVHKLLMRLEFALQQFSDGPSDRLLTDIEMLVPDDLDQIWSWNKAVPPAIDRYMDELVESHVQADPNALAVCAWDGELTYGQLSELAGKIATHLINIGIGVEPGVIVPLCFEKSMWTPVAMLGVLKAGGAFVLLDTSLPESRLQSIVDQTKAPMILSSSTNVALSARLSSSVIQVGWDEVNRMETTTKAANRSSPSSSAMFAVFTSGSTGVPKGAVLTHSNFCSSLEYQAEQLGFSKQSRVFDFASYSFDIAVHNVFAAFGTGGCLCIPSDTDRKENVGGAMASMRVTIAELTPTVARLLNPNELPDLKTLILVGEAVSTEDVLPWWGKVRVVNGYGPAECGIATISNAVSSPNEALYIGKGAGLVTWVVDPDNHDRLLAPGCIGELLLEGPLVGAGYLNEPEKTGAVFIEDPAWLLKGAPNFPGRHGKLYKTGDLVQYLEDGTLMFLGRKDIQVKIRGQRVELGEVEHWVHKYLPESSLVAAEVIVPQGDKAKPTLAAFVQISAEDLEPDSATIFYPPADLRESLATSISRHMIPSVFFCTAQLPLTPSGKINRKRLREIAASFSAQDLAKAQTTESGPKREPTTSIEYQMRHIWARVLGLKPSSIGLDDSFLQLGGDSIIAMKITGEARYIGLEISVASIFQHSTLDEICKNTITIASPQLIEPTPIAGPVQQSFAQERLWFLDQLHPGLNWYLMPYAVRIRGPLQLTALQSAVNALEDRHETLRTTFTMVDGINMQIVQTFQPKTLSIVDISSDDEKQLQDELRSEQSRTFNLTTQPGWRIVVYRLGTEDHVLSIVMHHIISDGWSLDVLRKELALLYKAAVRGEDLRSRLKPMPIQYRDYSIWQKESKQRGEQQRQLDYWLKQLNGSRPVEFLCDKPRPDTLSGNGNMKELRIDGGLYSKMQALCKVYNVTPYTLLLAAFRATHFRMTGAHDATIGTPHANRDRRELQDMIGFFVNVQCIRIQIEDDTFEELVQQVHKTTLAAFAHQAVPFEEIVSNLQKKRDLSRSPIVQVAFALHSQLNLGEFVFDGADTEPILETPTSRFDLEFHFYQEENALRGNILYSTDLYVPETIEAIARVFKQLLEQAFDQPKKQIASLPLISDAEFSAIQALGMVEIEKTEFPRDSNLIETFEQQVRLYPNKVAVKDSSSRLTYAQLHDKSNNLAHWLRGKSFAPETLIGVLANRSCQTIVAFLGILKANLAYMPFDPKLPLGRMQTILSSIQGRKLILVGKGVDVPVIPLDEVEFIAVCDVPDENLTTQSSPPPTPSASSLACVMFTSGSTGKPKGVMIEHRAILRLVKNSNVMQHNPTEQVSTHISNIGFDVAVWEIFGTLLNGGTLICIGAMELLDYSTIPKILCREQVEVITITPALFKQYLMECPMALSKLKVLYIGGDRFDPRDEQETRKFFSGKIINCYGPTENTAISTIYEIPPAGNFNNGFPIGKAISNSGAYVMDPQLNIVPRGVMGELVLSGDGIARGYTDPERNSGRFVFVTIAGRQVRAYRTGDHVRYRPIDGQIEFFGRIDNQIKIRGQRLELDEIDHVLRSHPTVTQAVTLLQKDSDQEARLVSFVSVRNNEEEHHQSEEDHSESQHIDAWEERFGTESYQSLEQLQPKDIGRDFIGWTSMYDGTDIDKVEMNEWIDDTIRDIRNGTPVGSVLEIGSGSGMILFNILEGLKSYVGVELSQLAIESICKSVKMIPGLEAKTQMYKATAMDVGRLGRSVSANLVICNSVAQYFPSRNYLFRVIKQLAQLDGLEVLYFGDMRSYAMYRQFTVSKALRIAGERASKDDLRWMVEGLECAELELLVDPAFFTALPELLPDFIGHVEILPKKMIATNELSCYRYAAVLHVKTKLRPGQVQGIDHDSWIDFSHQRLDRQSLSQLLQRTRTSGEPVAVSNIPYSKTIFERHVIESLDDSGPCGGDWLQNARQKSAMCPSMAAVDLQELARDNGYSVEVSWARQHIQRGGIDAIFHKCAPVKDRERVLFDFPTDYKGRLSRTFTNHPLRRQRWEKTRAELLDAVRNQLPSYMVPQTITILEEMPVNQNGKVDRRVLASKVPTGISSQVSRATTRPPTNELQRQMQVIWGEVLNIPPTAIGLDDSFFQLGGHSMSAMKVISASRKVGLKLTVMDIFHKPTLEHVANQARTFMAEAEKIAPFSLLESGCDSSVLLRHLSSQYQLDEQTIQDAFPCTPLQEGLISLTLKSPGDYIMQGVFELPKDVNIRSLRHAWEEVALKMPILRTRIVDHDDFGPLQVVLDEDINWIDATYLDAYLELDKSQVMGLGQPLARYALVKDETDSERWFVWTLHHALYDGWSMSLVIDAVSRVYQGQSIPQGPQFQSFIQHIQAQPKDEATDYWCNSLAGETAAYPPLPSTMKQPRADTLVEHSISYVQEQRLGLTTPTLIRAAWAVVISRMTGSNDVVFGATVSGRHAPVAGIDCIAGPTIATIPVRIKLSDEDTVTDYLQKVHKQATDMIQFEQTGLHHIAQMSADCKRACMFQTLLVVQPQVTNISAAAFGQLIGDDQIDQFNTYALNLELCLESERITAKASFDSQVIQEWAVRRLLVRFDSVLRQLNSVAPELLLGNINALSPQDLNEIWDWNCEVPHSVDIGVHKTIQEWSIKQPEALALCAWDGEISYGDLESLSTQLASHLAATGVRPGVAVGLCFEKSKWTTIAMLGTMKAGGFFVLLDSDLPMQRLQQISHKVSPLLILSSSRNSTISLELCRDVLVLDDTFFEQDQHKGLSNTDLPEHNVDAPNYIVFTSGTTGTPKGALISYRNLASAVHYQSKAYGHNQQTRLYDHASYAFDVAISNCFNILAAGGCLCVPNGEGRKNDLAASIRSLAPNTLDLTPSVARLLSPEEVPSVQSIIIGGEAFAVTDIQPWWGRASVLTAYGPSECTPTTVMNLQPSSPEHAVRLGKGVGSNTWVVNPENHDILVPPGCVGELLLEGPLVGLGYIGDPAKTASAFIENPKWLLRGSMATPGRQGRLYKTGDLVRYCQDGSLSFLGRRDTQVKINGQRVELAEIEHQLYKSMSHVSQLVVDIIAPEGDDSNPTLAAFFRSDDIVTQLGGSKASPPAGAQILAAPEDVLSKLAETLPRHMIPTAFLALPRLPLGPTGKMDRKRLRALGSSLSKQQLVDVQTSRSGPKKMPTTEVERQIQNIWAHALNIGLSSIGIADSFFQLGGDSIIAMKVVGAARKVGIQLSVADIFRYKTIEKIATAQKTMNTPNIKAELNQVVLIDQSIKSNILAEIDKLGIDISSEDVLDILPVTSMQSRFIANGIQMGQFCNYFHVNLGHNINLSLLEKSWRSTLDRFPILRARFLPVGGSYWQVIPRQFRPMIKVQSVTKDLTESSHEFCLSDVDSFSPTEPPFGLILFTDASQGTRMTIRLSHAQYDGISLPVILQSMSDAYQGKPLVPIPDYSRFLSYSLNRRNESIAYWKKLLRGSSPTVFPQDLLANGIAKSSSPGSADAQGIVDFPILPGNITAATLVNAAWGVLLSLVTGKRDVVYGSLVNGRNSRLKGIEEIVGPCINYIPVRATMSPLQTPSELLSSLQKQFMEIEEADSLGYRDIAKYCTEWSDGASFEFNTTILHQNIDEHLEIGFLGSKSPEDWFTKPNFAVPSGIRLVTYPAGERLRITIYADTNSITTTMAARIPHVLGKLMWGLSTQQDMPLSSLMGEIDIHAEAMSH